MDIIALGIGQPVIVALHGIQGSRSSWLPVAQRCEDVARWILPNLRGRGTAMRGSCEADYSLNAYATELATIVDEVVDDAPYILAGWSLGVSIALEFLSARIRRQPQGVVLLSGSPCLAQVQWFHGQGEVLLAAVAAREARLGLREAADHQAVAWTWGSVSKSDQRRILADITVPALVLHGAIDEDCPVKHAAWLHEGLRHSTLVTLAGAGHGLLTQHTTWVAQQIRGFMTSIEQRRALHED